MRASRELPDRAQYPEYYILIKSPLSLACIKKKMADGVYRSATAIEA